MRCLALPPVLVLLLLGGCDSFEPATLVQSLRVLAMVAEPAELASGEQATLRALVVDQDPQAAGRAVSLEWAICDKVPRPGVEIDPDCWKLDSAEFITPLVTQADGSTQVTMPPHTITDLGLPDSTGGLYVPVRLRVRAGGTTVTAFHKLRWKAGFLPANANPRLEGLAYVPTEGDGELPDLGQTVVPQPLPDDSQAPLELPRGGKLRLRASAQPGSAEPYVTFTGDIGAISDPSMIMTQNVNELVRFFWYTSAGDIGTEVTGEERPDTTLDTTQYDSSVDARGGLVDIWLVAREERGGHDYLHRQIRLK